MSLSCEMSMICIGDARNTLLPITAYFVEADDRILSGRVKGVYRQSYLPPWILNFLLSDRAKVQVHLRTDSGPSIMSGDFRLTNFKVFQGREDVNEYLCDITSLGAIEHHAQL